MIEILPAQRENQTIFQQEEPLLSSYEPKKPPKKLSKRTKMLMGAGAFIIFLLIILFMTPKKPRDEDSPTATPTPTVTQQQTQTPLDVLFQELATDMKEADPTENTYIFPPLRVDIQVSSDR